MRPRLSPRLVRPLVAMSVLLVSSGCLSLLDVDEDPYSVADGGHGGDDGGGGGQHDASLGGDDDGSTPGSDGASALGDAGADARPCDRDALGWHLDCDFQNGGLLHVLSPVETSAAVVTQVDDGGALYLAASEVSPQTASLWVMTLSPQGVVVGNKNYTIAGALLDMRVASDSTPEVLSQGLVPVTNATAVVAATLQSPSGHANTLATSQGGQLLQGLNILRIDEVDSTWTIALAGSFSSSATFYPWIGSIDVVSGTPSAAPAQGSLSIQASRAIAIGANAWFVDHAGQSVEVANMADASAPFDFGCGITHQPFADLLSVNGVAVGLAPTRSGFELEALTLQDQCSPLATVDAGDAGPLTTQTRYVHLAAGTVADAGSLAVVAPQVGSDGGTTLFTGHFTFLPDGGTSDGVVPFGLSSLVTGARSDIDFGAGGDSVSVGPPVLVGGLLYVPVTTTPPAELDAGDASAPVSTLILLRLAYTAPP